MKHKHNPLPELLIFGLFALCLLLTVLTGARVYRQTVEKSEISSAERTKLHYLTTKIHHSRDISPEDFGGCQALALRETIDGEAYVTYIYCHEGWLRELFCTEGAALTPEDGEKVTPAEQMEVSVVNGLLTLQIDGETLYFQIDSP